MTQVALCNRALLTIGEAGNITSITPPYASPHAQLCATLYQSALEIVNSAINWSFADKRDTLAKPRIAVSSVNATDNILTLSTTHYCETNDQVTLVDVTGSSTAPAGLEFDETYYVIEHGSTTLRLTDEEDGTAIDITTAGSGSFALERESDRPGVYMFSKPTDCLVARAVVPLETPDDWMNGAFAAPTTGMPSSTWNLNYSDQGQLVRRQPIPFRAATNKAGEQVYYTPLDECDLIYTKSITDVTQMPPDFQQAVVFQLAASLASAIKRDNKEADYLMMRAQTWISRAAEHDARDVVERKVTSYPWDR